MYFFSLKLKEKMWSLKQFHYLSILVFLKYFVILTRERSFWWPENESKSNTEHLARIWSILDGIYIVQVANWIELMFSYWLQLNFIDFRWELILEEEWKCKFIGYWRRKMSSENDLFSEIFESQEKWKKNLEFTSKKFKNLVYKMIRSLF